MPELNAVCSPTCPTPDEAVSDAPLLSVIIVSYNTRTMTLDCLRALHDELAALPAGTRADVWLVDNGSHDGSAQAVRAQFPGVRVLANATNRGFAAANNQAMMQARGLYVLLLNSDAFCHDGAIASLLQTLQAHPDAAAVGPRLLNADGTLQPSCYRFPGPFRALCEHLLLTAAFPNHPVMGDFRASPHDAFRDDVDFVIGACLLVRRSAIETVGFLDEAFFLYGEEADWCFRLKRAGWKVAFTSDAVVTHHGGASGEAQSAQVFCEFRKAQERFLHKYYGLFGLLFFRLVLVFGAMLRLTLFGIQSLVRPAKRSVNRSLLQQWTRILLWTLGRRGTGLAERAEQEAAL